MPRDGRDDFDLLLDLIAGDQDESETLTPTARSTLLPLSVPAAATLNFHRTKDNLTTRIPRQRHSSTTHTRSSHTHSAESVSAVTETRFPFIPSHRSPASPNLTGIEPGGKNDVSYLCLPLSQASPTRDLSRSSAQLSERKVDTSLQLGVAAFDRMGKANQATTRTSYSPSRQTSTYPFICLSSSTELYDTPYRTQCTPQHDIQPADENPFEFVMKKTLPDRYLHPQEVNLAGSSSSMDQDTPSEKSQSLQASQRHGVPLFLHPPDPPKPASFTDLRDAVRSSIDKKRRATAALSESLHFAKHEGYKLKDNCDQLNHLANDLHPSSDAPSPPNPRPRRRARFAPGIKPPPPSSLVSKPLPSIPSSFESWTTDGAYPDDDPTLPRSLGPSHNASQEQDELHGVEEKQTSQSAHPMHLSTSTTVSALQRRRDGRTSPPMDEIEFLSGSQARRALRALLAALGLPPIVPDPLILDQHPNEQPPLTPSHMHRALSTDPSSLEDVLRALDFVRFADHVIGGGDQGPEGQKVIFSEDNLKGVVDRLLLWEQAAHST